jgi:hypothetical protein
MTYKGYEAIVEFDEDAKVLAGEVINTRDVITFQADAADQMNRRFTIRWMTISTFANQTARSQKGHSLGPSPFGCLPSNIAKLRSKRERRARVSTRGSWIGWSMTEVNSSHS